MVTNNPAIAGVLAVSRAVKVLAATRDDTGRGSGSAGDGACWNAVSLTVSTLARSPGNGSAVFLHRHLAAGISESDTGKSEPSKTSF
jgi:hypothetical protein